VCPVLQSLTLCQASRGRVICVSSVTASLPAPGLSVYTATKAAIEGWAAVARMEFAKFGVKVVTVQPGDFSKATNLLTNHHRNMNQMWGEMTDINRQEYKQFFLAYHDSVSRSGFTGERRKPLTVLPARLTRAFELAVLAKLPQHNYRVLPCWSSALRLALLSLLPRPLLHRYIQARYSKSIPALAYQYEARGAQAL